MPWDKLSSKESQTLVHLGAGSPVVYVSPHIITLHLTHLLPKTFASMHVTGADRASKLWLPNPLKKGRLSVIWSDGAVPLRPYSSSPGVSSGGVQS